jgi:hypothetical protein
MQWMHARAERMMHLANGTRTHEVERLWLGTLTPATIELILQEDVHKTLSTTQYSQYCKVITEMTKIRSLVAESMINARYQHYHEERRRARQVSKRLPPRGGKGTRKQRKIAARERNQKCIDNMFQPIQRSQRSIRRQDRYRAMQRRMTEIRSIRAQKTGGQPPVVISQSRILLLPVRHRQVPPLLSSPPQDDGRQEIQDVPPVPPGNIIEDVEEHPARPIGRMITANYRELVTHNDIELDKRLPLRTHPVDRSMGTDTHDIRVPARQRDG